jgi:hypothetical protein
MQLVELLRILELLGICSAVDAVDTSVDRRPRREMALG